MIQTREYKDYLAAAFATKLEEGASIAEVAAEAARLLSCITRELTPIISKADIAAIHRRSARLFGRGHPQPSGNHDGPVIPSSFSELLTLSTAAGAAETGASVLLDFFEQLVNLIGNALTERLLKSVWSAP